MLAFFRGGSSVPWHRSLYGRIAMGYIVLIAIVLAAQAVTFLWLVERITWSGMPGLTKVLSRDLAERLTVEPNLDLMAYAQQAHPTEHVFVVMADGRIGGERTPSDVTIRNAIEDMRRSHDAVRTTWEEGPYRAVGVVVGGRTVGVLGVVPPTTREQFGFEFAVTGLGFLIAGTLLSSALIFGPVQRRIDELQRAAQRFGGGDFTARARAEGSDEVAELARSFNAMADGLAARDVALSASNRARQQLLADVSHELMTPLTAVLGHLETLTMAEVQLNDDRRLHHVAVARREAQRLERLVGDLLETARLEAGGGDLEPETIPTPVLFEQVVTHHEWECRERHIAMSYSVAPEAAAVFGDPFRLEQALQNLTGNALRHTPNGGSVTLSANASEGAIVLAVTDSGEGIAPEDLPLIFDRFYKARASDRVASRGSGSGLGLSIVKAIVTRHAGRVSASSMVGQGTTVQIVLPLAPAPTSDHHWAHA